MEYNFPMSTKKILIVDDEEELVEIFKIILERENYDVDFCLDGVVAQQMIEKNEYDLILSDIHMPKLSGMNLLKWISKIRPTLRVILITGHIDETDAQDALEAGCFGFLAKPVSKKELVRVVKNAVSDFDSISFIDFARIPLQDFLCGKIVNFPVYVKLSDSRFLKIAHSGTEINLTRVQELKQRGVTELWIEKEDFSLYIKLCEQLVEALSKKEGWDPKKKVILLKHATEVAYEQLRAIRLSPEVISYGLSQLHSMFDILFEHHNLASIVMNFKNGPAGHFSNAVMGATLSGLVARLMGWDNQKNLDSLVLGAFLKDIGMLKLPIELQEKHPSKMNGREWGEYSLHPIYSLELLQEVESLSKETLKIIIEHHETGDEKAFPNKVEKRNIFAMSKIVCVVNQFIEEVELAKIKNEFDEKKIIYYINRKGDLLERGKISYALELLLTKSSYEQAQKAFKLKVKI